MNRNVAWTERRIAVALMLVVAAASSIARLETDFMVPLLVGNNVVLCMVGDSNIMD